MMYNFENVYDRMSDFKNECEKIKHIRKFNYSQIMSAKSKKFFMDAIYANFYYINKYIDNFDPKFEIADDFSEGFSIVLVNGLWGYIKTDGSYLVKPKFDYAYQFNKGIAMVEIDGKRKYIDTTGKYITTLTKIKRYFLNLDGE